MQMYRRASADSGNTWHEVKISNKFHFHRGTYMYVYNFHLSHSTIPVHLFCRMTNCRHNKCQHQKHGVKGVKWPLLFPGVWDSIFQYLY